MVSGEIWYPDVSGKNRIRYIPNVNALDLQLTSSWSVEQVQPDPIHNFWLWMDCFPTALV